MAHKQAFVWLILISSHSYFVIFVSTSPFHQVSLFIDLRLRIAAACHVLIISIQQTCNVY